IPVSDLAGAEAAADHLRGLGVKNVIVTLGAQGALFASAQGLRHYPAPVVQPLDATAAGDTFVGGFAAALAQGAEEGAAIAFGQRAAALSVTRAGAQPSIPYLAELQP
ncbi:MAG: PfkB family carbohydrate kinase, partial [Pseudomonas sp.]